ncbi:hypothetical protein [Clostridium mobile]|nr:hypothetical protein [Clostridium mobile]
MKCNKCCIACKIDNKFCEYRKDRSRAVNKMLYKARKEKLKEIS